MDFLSPLFELDKIDDLFPFSPFPLHEPQILHSPLVPSLERENVFCKTNRKRKISKHPTEINENVNKNEYANKKIVHRDIERQRRQELAALNRSLKSLLPPENLKGKRSLCDHIHETVNYIGHMKNKIEELKKKKDVLKRPLNNKLTIFVGSKCLLSNTNETGLDEEIIARANIQIILSTNLNAEVAISRLLHLLIQEGLNVISYTSANLNERLVHTIESEVSEGRSINPYELQKKLKYLVA